MALDWRQTDTQSVTIGPRPSHQMHPSGRSTQRTSRASLGDTAALEAIARSQKPLVIIFANS